MRYPSDEMAKADPDPRDTLPTGGSWLDLLDDVEEGRFRFFLLLLLVGMEKEETHATLGDLVRTMFTMDLSSLVRF